jgi:hypothetical protein
MALLSFLSFLEMGIPEEENVVCRVQLVDPWASEKCEKAHMNLR